MNYKELLTGVIDKVKTDYPDLVLVLPNEVNRTKSNFIRVTSIPFDPIRLELNLSGLRRYSGIIQFDAMSSLGAGTAYGDDVYSKIHESLFGQIITTTNHQINILNISIGPVDLVNSQSGLSAHQGFMYPILVQWESFN